MTLNATSRVANIDTKFANTLILLLRFKLITTQLSRGIIAVILLTLCIQFIAKKCPEAQYIVETSGNFRYRFNNHTPSIRQEKLLPLPLHFNADDHNINDLNVWISKDNFNDTKHRKLIELQFIINFETNKFGFNKDISFLSKYDTFKH